MAALGATLAAALAPTATTAPPGPRAERALSLDTAPLQPTPTKQAPPAPVLLTSTRRRRRVLALTVRPASGGADWARPARHRYNRAAHRHARNGWSRQGHS